MTPAEPAGATGGLDALLPREMARRAEAVGVAKAAMDAATTLVLGGLAGAFIALGAVFALVVLAGAPPVPDATWGPLRVLAGAAFSLGLILVVVGGAELFTGNSLIVLAWASRRIPARALLRNWALVFAGNFAGALGTAALVYLGGTHELGAGAIGVAAVGIAAGKVQLAFGPAVARGVLCNVLVCLAVWLTLSARSTADRILAIVPPIAAFVAAGFEHSVANMFLVPLGLLITRLDPAFVAGHDLGREAAALTWRGFLADSLLPVTLGNLIGGVLLVGLVYWFVYLRPRGA